MREIASGAGEGEGEGEGEEDRGAVKEALPMGEEAWARGKDVMPDEAVVES
jgi:hypothetical protein